MDVPNFNRYFILLLWQTREILLKIKDLKIHFLEKSIFQIIYSNILLFLMF